MGELAVSQVINAAKADPLTEYTEGKLTTSIERQELL